MEVSHIVFKYIALVVMAMCHSISATCSSQAKVENGKAQYTDIQERPVKSNISLTYDTKGLQPVFDIATSFMNTVQPKGFVESFKEEDLEKFFKGDFGEDEWKKIIEDYELPIAITLGVGLLFVILMPIVGCCFCMCRCCDRCGGDMKQSEKKAKQHCRVTFMVFLLFAFTVLMLCGVLFMFVTNDRMHEAVGGMEKKLDEVLGETDTLVKTVTDDIDVLANDQVQCVTGLVRRGIGKEGLTTKIGDPLKIAVSANVSDTLREAEVLVTDVDSIATTLGSANVTQTSFNTNIETLKQDIQKGKNDKNTIHTTRCTGAVGPKKVACDELNNINLDIKIDTSGMPDIKDYLSKVKDIQDQKLGDSIAKGKKMVNDIPQLVIDKTKGPLKSVYDQLNSTEVKVSDAAGDASSSIQEGYNNFTTDKTMNEIRDILNNDDFKKFEAIRWKVYVALSAVMAFIVFLLFCGLACGSCGYNKDYMPTERSATANCGGNFLMAAVGIMFIFSFIFMIFCVVWFGAGMHLHIACRELKDGKLIDDVIERVESFPEDFKNLSMVESLRNCRKNMPIYEAVDVVAEKFDIDKIFNMSMFDKVESDIKGKIDFDMGDDKVLTPEAKKAMEDVKNYTIDYATIKQILNMSIMTRNLTEIVIDLGKLANQVRSADSDMANDIDGLKSDLSDIQKNTITNLESNVDDFSSNVDALERQLEPLKTKTSTLLAGLEQSEVFVKNKIKELVQPYTEELLGYVRDGVTHVKDQVRTKVLRCKPVSNIYDGVINTFMCSNLVQNSNGFWLALGWCLLFFIPAIIVSVKLAKYFRKMDYSTGRKVSSISYFGGSSPIRDIVCLDPAPLYEELDYLPNPENNYMTDLKGIEMQTRAAYDNESATEDEQTRAASDNQTATEDEQSMDIQVDHPPYNDKLPHHTPPYTTGYSSHGGPDLRAPPPYTSTQHNNPGYQHA